MALSDYVVAGYFLALPEKRREGFNDPDLIPPEVFSASGCMGNCVPGEWCTDFNERVPFPEGLREEWAGDYGIQRERVPAILAWTRPRVGTAILPPNLCATREVLAEFRALIGRANARLTEIGVALPGSEVAHLFAEATRFPGPEGPWLPGVPLAISRGESPAPGGVVLGHEPVTGADGHSCSWLCNAAEKGVHAALGIRPNANGLIESVDDAIRACAWIDEDTSRGEPGPWFPWLLIRCDA